jgi:hypothetical protein
MRLGVSYNAFDGCEHLKESILSIFDQVDYISIVYQDISNSGNKISERDKEYIMECKQCINDIVEFTPDLSLIPSENELIKRNIGLALSDANNCTHHLSIDCDEIYNPVEFERAKKKAVYYDSTYCQMQTYYKDINHVIDPPEEYYVPFIYLIDDRKFERLPHYPVIVDPTRKMKAGDYYIYRREELQMHHYSYIREDMKRKLINSSARRNFEQIEECVNYYNNWKPGMDGMNGKGEKFKLKKI